jgi:hypothetical protein
VAVVQSVNPTTPHGWSPVRRIEYRIPQLSIVRAHRVLCHRIGRLTRVTPLSCISIY